MPLQRITGQMVTDASLTGADVQDGSLTAADLVAGTLAATRDTAKATTSGVAIEFTGIPSWARRVTVVINGASTNGTSDILVQLGTGGAPTVSGYTGASVFSWGSGVVPVSSAAGIPVFNNAASYNHFGQVLFTNISGNTWLASGQIASIGVASSMIIGGVVTLSGVLDYLRVVASNGVDTFDAGSVNLLYE